MAGQESQREAIFISPRAILIVVLGIALGGLTRENSDGQMLVMAGLGWCSAEVLLHLTGARRAIARRRLAGAISRSMGHRLWTLFAFWSVCVGGLLVLSQLHEFGRSLGAIEVFTAAFALAMVQAVRPDRQGQG
jgi:hypothetical protein